MKTKCFLVLLAAQFYCVSVQAFRSIDFYQTGGNPFSEEFTTNYASALKECQASHSFASFSNMVIKFKKPQEQAELEITMGIGYCQWSGCTDDRKAIEHLGNALFYDLPPTVLLGVYLDRGGCKERLKQKRAALEDYLRGLAECLRYQLPAKPPEYLRPNVVYDVVFAEPGDDAVKEQYRQLRENQERQLRQFRFEEVMIRERDILIEVAKRVSSGDAEQIRLAAETVVADKSKIQQVEALITAPDPKP